MFLKVHGGTVQHGDTSLCVTCRHSTIIRGRTLDEEIVDCHEAVMHGRRVPFKVTFCSGYSDLRQPTYTALVQDAWILQPGSRKRPAGFVRGSDLKMEELAALMAEATGRE